MDNNAKVDDFLTHYGVLGMKWGRRKSGISSRPTADSIASSGKTSPKLIGKGQVDRKITKEDIKTARSRQLARKQESHRLMKEAGKQTSGPNKGKYNLTKEQADLNNDWVGEMGPNKNSDHWVANHKTRGEQVVATMLAGPIGAVYMSNFKFRVGQRAANNGKY